MIGKKKEPETETQQGFVTRLRARLNRGKSWLTHDFATFAPSGKIDDDVLEVLEADLVMADVGVEASEQIISGLQKALAREELKHIDAVRAGLQSALEDILTPAAEPLDISGQTTPFVILVVGVNGVGKTTTIGKLANWFRAHGKTVMLAAGDTFRAAAIEQLQAWGKQNNVPVIAQQKGADPAAVVFDAYKAAKSRGEVVGAGRGSAAGSLVLYLLGVTDIDPLEYDLIFERFYNAGRSSGGRISLPDVDMDFEKQKREDTIDYIKSQYGYDKVAQIMTFSRMQGRSALKDVLRAHSACSYDEMNLITGWIPDEAEISDQLQEMREADKESGGDGDASIIQWALENHAEELSQWCYIDDNGSLQGSMARRFEQAIRLEGTKRSQSKHAAGIVISQSPLDKVCPMVYDKKSGEMIAGMEMGDLESMGHVKFDILGVAMLDKIHGVQNIIKTGELDG